MSSRARLSVLPKPSHVIIVVAATLISACATRVPVRSVPMNVENPDHRRLTVVFAGLLQAAGLDTGKCRLGIIDTVELNAASFGRCKFAITTGVLVMHDERLLLAALAHEVAHELLGHAESRRQAAEAGYVARQAVAFVPYVGLPAAWALYGVEMLAMAAYSRSQEAEADSAALELLRAVGDDEPTGTMRHLFSILLSRYGNRGGGFLATHPATEERLATLAGRGAERPRVAIERPAVVCKDERPYRTVVELALKDGRRLTGGLEAFSPETWHLKAAGSQSVPVPLDQIVTAKNRCGLPDRFLVGREEISAVLNVYQNGRITFRRLRGGIIEAPSQQVKGFGASP